ncbi:MAG: DUF2470 domain-containing protein [Pseudomonadota bacterium]
MSQNDVLRTVDDEARHQARNFLRTARHGALATIDPDTGVPMASRVSLATSADGSPIFLISQLSGHFGALESDARASLLIGEPGKGDPLAHPRITVYGRALKLEDEARGIARGRFLARHPKAELYADFGDFAFWKLELDGASLNGGFGKAYALSKDDLIAPIEQSLEAMEAGAVTHMNEDHLDAIELYATKLLGRPQGNWRLACIDPEGLDMTLGDEVARLWFDPPLKSAEELRPRLVALAKRARMDTRKDT